MYIWLLILGMLAVTYIPRALPAVLADKFRFGGRTEKFLKLIPYTAMAAMIFPGVFTVDAADSNDFVTLLEVFAEFLLFFSSLILWTNEE